LRGCTSCCEQVVCRRNTDTARDDSTRAIRQRNLRTRGKSHYGKKDWSQAAAAARKAAALKTEELKHHALLAQTLMKIGDAAGPRQPGTWIWAAATLPPHGIVDLPRLTRHPKNAEAIREYEYAIVHSV
jgi:hypothetical protein